ncbi:MAG: diphosphate--fructose-6-phosphate 1-phosphotransferase [Eubacteriales bacterium]|nr:diphosphate--fructose-6-phosphate 1-phosphotransferase [Eubacteriales bacterium]
MKGNVLVVHGGGPTAVMNASLYGVIMEARANPQAGDVYGALGGMEGMVKGRIMNLSAFDDDQLRLLLTTPGSAIGSSRYPVSEEEYEKIPEILKKYEISYLLPNGGNGTMDTCGKIYQYCRRAGYGHIRVVGIPKTIDNDIAVTDHTPGYGSAARYLAGTVKEVAADVKSLPIHVCVIEAQGRNSGWIAASAALAREKKGDAPHLIYTPERPFCEEEFLEDVKELYDRLGGVVVVASEGLRKADGSPIVEPIFRTERAVYYGDVGTHLANLVVKKLGIKARGEKPGLCGRASVPWQSPVDQEEARAAGAEALKMAVSGCTGVMVGFFREKAPDAYRLSMKGIPIEQVMMLEKPLPREYINDRGNDVTEDFVRWCRPLIGPELPKFLSFQDYWREPGI